MSETRRPRSSPAGQLPAEFDPHLVELDQKLADDVGSRQVPVGLAERTFRASVSRLPARDQRGPLRLTRPSRTPVWGQLAMAASVAAAFMVAAWFHSSSVMSPTASDQGYAHHTPQATEPADVLDEAPRQTELRTIERAELLSPEALRLLFEGGSDYLLDTRDLTHAEAVDDLHRLYEHLSEL